MAKSSSKVAAKASVTEVKVSNAKAAALGTIFGNIGDTIGNASVETDYVRESAIEQVESYLKEAMTKHGLQVEMLKAPSKQNPGELWTIIVDAMNIPRRYAYCAKHNAKEKDESKHITPETMTADQKVEADLRTSVRDNYLSKIRNFIRDRGANPLDLYGNIAQAKADKERKLANAKAKEAVDAAKQSSSKETHVESEESTSEESTSEEKAPVMNAKGAVALRDFLSLWIAQNNEGKVSAELEFLLDTADDLLDAVKDFISKKTSK